MSTETKKQRFQRLAEKRTNDVLERLRILGNCANRGQYEYSAEEVRKIFRVIEAEVNLVKMKFKDGETQKFTLS
ncbi:MAG: hypothetical protein ACRD4B_02315 [Acidobacteriota bacterium]